MMWFKNIVWIALLSASPAIAGGWISSGGEIVKDANNPWFLANTKHVTYCIAIASQGYPYDADQTEPFINDAFHYWQTEFARTTPWFPEARVATQTFSRVDCNANPDIVFQMGFLTNSQQKVLENPEDYVSLAIRTDYDQVQLRGRGFIYISAESGRFRPRSSRFLEHPWQECNGCRLKRAGFHLV